MSIRLLKRLAELREAVRQARQAGQRIGLVPTMGALHAGHGTLIDRARAESGFVIVTIFVNPFQFDRPSDFERYTRNLPADLAYCQQRGADAVFAPDAAEVYPHPPRVFVEAPGLSEHLCGANRPGHFRGVATVVAKLFQMAQPDAAYFGEKDAQQLAIIQAMVEDLNMPIAIVPVPTVRDPDGLAISSRNSRLTPQERSKAPLLYRALQSAANGLAAGAVPAQARQSALDMLSREPAIKVEYLEVVDARSMTPVDQIRGPVRIAAAIWLGETRLIDNIPT